MPRQVILSEAAYCVRVVAGILRNRQGFVLIADRPNANSMRGYWEFPGGKLQEDELPEDALRRELQEEIGINALSLQHFYSLEHQYVDQLVAIEFYLVSAWDGTPRGREDQELQWIDPALLGDDVLLPADLPVLNALRDSRNLESDYSDPDDASPGDPSKR